MTWRIICADVLEGLAELPDASVQTVVTSPPYWGLRDYGTAEWEGGDAACDHKRERQVFHEGCSECGGPMSGVTPGCFKCGDRLRKRRDRDIPEDRDYPAVAENHWEAPRSRDQVTEASIPYRDICGKCGAVRKDRQIGLEPTPEAYVERMVAVFREVRRVLRSDGTVWLNLGDSYNNRSVGRKSSHQGGLGFESEDLSKSWAELTQEGRTRLSINNGDMKEKDLVGIPWMLAFALRAER